MKLITALATPYRNDRLDLNSYAKLLQSQNAADGLLCCGTTAEGALLSVCEKKLLIQIAKSMQPDKEIWVGISSGVTSEAIKEAVAAKKAGALGGLLITPPSFFKCTEQGFIQHVLALKDATDLPIMLYNAPSRCNYVLWKNAVKTLAERGVAFIKDAGSDIDYAKELSEKIRVFCGNEELLPQFVQNGAVGVVSVVSNVAPDLVKNVLEHFATKTPETGSASERQRNDCVDRLEKFRKLAKLAFCELNPIVVKYMLKKAGIFETFDMRLPLTAASSQTQKWVNEFWEEYSL